MSHKPIALLLLIAILGSCKEQQKARMDPGAVTEEAVEEKISEQTDAYSGEIQTTDYYCYASRTTVPKTLGDAYNYEFTRLHIGKDGKVTGTVINAPYGTDGSRGSITGSYHSETMLVESTTKYLAEGELYEEQWDYQIGEDGLFLLDANGAPVTTIPTVPCDQYDEYFREYQLGILQKRVNTKDRTRLKLVQELVEHGYSGAKLDSLRFMELWLDLDNDFGTEEYLLYIMDPMTCGSGGCNLFVIDGKGTLLSSTTVVKLPIYTTTSRINDVNSKGNWKTLYVWSQGFRELSWNGKYPGNASMAPRAPSDSLSTQPEKFQLILDYME